MNTQIVSNLGSLWTSIKNFLSLSPNEMVLYALNFFSLKRSTSYFFSEVFTNNVNFFDSLARNLSMMPSKFVKIFFVYPTTLNTSDMSNLLSNPLNMDGGLLEASNYSLDLVKSGFLPVKLGFANIVDEFISLMQLANTFLTTSVSLCLNLNLSPKTYLMSNFTVFSFNSHEVSGQVNNSQLYSQSKS